MSSSPFRLSGRPGTPDHMPGQVRAARVAMFVICALILTAGLSLLAFSAGDAEEFERRYEVAASTGVTSSLLYLGYGALGLTLGAFFVRGRLGVRAGAIVWSIAGLFVGLLMLPVGAFVILLAGAAVVLLALSPARDWFTRPRR